MSTGLIVDVRKVAMHKQLLGSAATGLPDRIALWTNNVVPDQSYVLTDLDLDVDTILTLDPAAWAYVLDAPNHQSKAQQNIDFDLSTKAGVIYYGLALYEIGTPELIYVERFDAAFTVPGGGINPLTIVILDYFHNC